MPRVSAVAAVLAAWSSATACMLVVDLDGFTGVSTAPSGEADADADAPASPCAAVDASADLLAWYPFEDGRGSVASDCSGHGIHASLVGAPGSLKWVPGRRDGTAMDLDGFACFDLGPAPSLGFTTEPFSISVWLMPRPASLANTTWIIARGGDVEGSTRGWRVTTAPPNIVELDLVTAARTVDVGAAVASGEWTHVAFTYDTSAARVFVNGVNADSHVGPGAITSSPDARARIGCKDPGVKAYDGVMDDLRIYRRALTDAEITALAQP